MIWGVYAVLGGFLIAAARDPAQHRSLIAFTVWSSVVHAVETTGIGRGVTLIALHTMSSS